MPFEDWIGVTSSAGVIVGHINTLLLILDPTHPGEVTIGQVAFGKYVLAQLGFGEHVWSMDRADPEAVAFFKSFLSRFTPLEI
ncbi:MAG: hypothetical protein Q7U55_02615 [Deltaproteobacteria bacterium]|nr:hypothetical protein [Deltaproteobacteria bacterium]